MKIEGREGNNDENGKTEEGVKEVVEGWVGEGGARENSKR